ARGRRGEGGRRGPRADGGAGPGPRRRPGPEGPRPRRPRSAATESYTTELPGERLRFLPLYSLMIATEPLPAAVWDELGWGEGLQIRDRRHLFFYAQRTADGRIAIGGRRAPYSLRRPIADEAERNRPARD